MPSLQAVSDQIKKLKITNAWLVRAEVNALSTILAEDEQIVGAIRGTLKGQSGLLIATHRRLIFVDKGLVRLAVRDFFFDQITSIEYKFGWALGDITIFTSWNKTNINKMTAAETRPFAETVRNLINAMPSVPLSAHNSFEAPQYEVESLPSPPNLLGSDDEIEPKVGEIVAAEDVTQEPKLAMLAVAQAKSSPARSSEPTTINTYRATGATEHENSKAGIERKVPTPSENWISIPRIICICLVGLMTPGAISNGFWIATVFGAASIAAALSSPLFARLKGAKSGSEPRAEGKGLAILSAGLSFVLAFGFVIALGIEAQNTPEGRARAVQFERARQEALRKAEVEEKLEKEEEARRERERRQEEEAKLRKEEAAEREEHRKGFHCLNDWDGSHWAMQNAVKENLRNPDSFEHIETAITPVDKNGHHQIIMKYRAQNGFGGVNVERAIGVIDDESCNLLNMTM